MQTRANKSRDSQSKAVADRSAVSKHAGNTAVMLADNRPEAENIARLQAMADRSPYSVAQRMQLEGLSGRPVQTRLDGNRNHCLIRMNYCTAESATSIWVAWSSPPGTSQIEKLLQMKKNPDGKWKAVKNFKDYSAFTVKGLEPSTSYSFRIVCQGIYSQMITCQTLAPTK